MLSLQDLATLSAEGKELEKTTFFSLVTRLPLNSFLVASNKSMKNGSSQVSHAYVPHSWEILLIMFTVVATASPVLCLGPVKMCGETDFQPYLTLVCEGGGGGGSSSPYRSGTVHWHRRWHLTVVHLSHKMCRDELVWRALWSNVYNTTNSLPNVESDLWKGMSWV